MSRGALENRVVVLLGGRAAKVLEFYEVSTGAADDLEKATEMLRHFRSVEIHNEALEDELIANATVNDSGESKGAWDYI